MRDLAYTFNGSKNQFNVSWADGKVAIIGVTTPNIPRWDGTKQGVADLTFEPMADAVAACIQEIGCLLYTSRQHPPGGI